MTVYTLPRANAPIAGTDAPTIQWYNFLRYLDTRTSTASGDVQAEITTIAEKLGSPDGSVDNIPPLSSITKVQGLDSIVASGLNIVQLQLVNDVQTPGNVLYYGTNGSGTKGWHLVYDAFANSTNITKSETSGIVSFDLNVSPSSWTVLTGSNLQGWLDSADANLTHVVSTGVHYGLEMTINGSNPSAIDVSAGNADILDNTNPALPTYTTLNFAGQTGIVVVNTSAPITYWSLDATGIVNQSIVAPTPDEFRTSIQLGSTMYNAGVISQVAHNTPMAQQAIAQIGDLYQALGFVNYGLFPYANGANLNFNVTAGRIAAYGANFFVDPLDPNFVSYAAQIPATFRYGTQTTQGATNVTTIDPSHYDVGGTITAIPGSSARATVQTVWQLTSGAIRAQYGQQYYNNLSEALANIATRAFIPNPAYAAEGGIIGAIVVEKSATDLSDTTQALFVKANKFGEFVSGTGSTTSVVSFNGRSGVVLPVLGDYPAELVAADIFSDFVVSGLLSTTSATLSSTLSAGVAYVTGLRTVVPATPYTYTALQDTYVDLTADGVLHYLPVANGGAVPAQTANSIRLQKVVSSATAITSVTQIANISAIIPAGINATPIGVSSQSSGSFSTLSTTGALPATFSGGAVTNSTYGFALYSVSPSQYNFVRVGTVLQINGANFIDQRISGTTFLRVGSVGVACGSGINPSSVVTIRSGTSAVNTAPLRIINGTLNTSPVSGQLEFSTNWYMTDNAGSRRQIQSTNYTTAPSGITVGASPFVYQNATGYDADVIVSGGTVSLVEFSRDGTTWFAAGLTSGIVKLSPLDRMRVTYTAAPTMTLVPR